MKIVVDAMGGDHAPKVVVEGVIEALNEFHNIHIILVGQQNKVRQELSLNTYPSHRIEVVHASDVVTMKDPATAPLRSKKKSSISVGLKLIKDGKADAFISAGNTGAVVAASTINLGMLKGVERPAIGLVIPTLEGFTFLIDVGANTDPKPIQMLQTAQMAKAYTRVVLGVKEPTVGLLNIGEESSKGSGFAKETHKLLEDRVTDFVGNVEANGLFKGRADCILADGYTGNVVIKVSQGLMEGAANLLKREIKKSPLAILGAFLMKSRLKHIRKMADYSEYGGAPLLGVNGVVMISHGRSNAKAVKNAIRATMQEVEHNILSEIAKVVE